MRKVLLCTLGLIGMTNTALGAELAGTVVTPGVTVPPIGQQLCFLSNSGAIDINTGACPTGIVYEADCYADSVACSMCNGTTELTNTTSGIIVATTAYLKGTLSGCNVTCDCETVSIAYKCQKNFYGSPTGQYDSAACQPCPEDGLTYTSGAQSITECYLPAGSNFEDNTGYYTLTDDCYWIN